jgi:hypothetical protein
MRGMLLLPVLVLFSSVALADPTRDEVVSGVQRCAGLADNRTWLDCFYGSAQPMRALLGLAPAPPAQIRLVPPPGAVYPGTVAARRAPPERSGSFVHDILGSSKPAVSNVPMASYRFERDGKFVVVLRNGESYRQIESDLAMAKWDRAPETYLVTIIGGSESFVLKVKNQPGVIYHVRRM